MGRAARRLARLYRLELEWQPEQFVIDARRARALLRDGGPPSGLLVLETGNELRCALYLDPQAGGDPDTLVEETSHLVCYAWHAAQERSVSPLGLELQSEVDRYLMARLDGRDALRHFERFRWASWLSPEERERYATAHRAAHRYCLSLAARYPGRGHTPELIGELRHFYRASLERKLRAGEEPPARA